jgi:hypothetical protein
MSSMHPLSNNNSIWSKGILCSDHYVSKNIKNIKNYISIYIYIYELNPLWKEPKLGSCNCIPEFNVTRTKSEFVFTSTTGFLSGKVTDICWSGGNPQIARVRGPGAPTRIVGNLVEQWASVSTFYTKTPPTWVVMIVQIMGKWEII